MTAPETAAPVRPEPGEPPARGPRDRRSRIRRYAVPVVPAVVTLLVTLAGIFGPSYWIDEAATISMTQRSLPDFWRTIDHLDLVHALYYLLLRPWAAVFGTGEAVLRFPSAAAMALAASVVAVLGRRCASPAVGVFAGLAFGCSATVTRYAQDARPFAAAVMLPAHLEVRKQDERLDDLRAAADILREHARPGDAVLFLAPDLRWRAQAYPDAYEELRDVLLDRTGPQAANLVGTDITDGRILRLRLSQSPRVWVMRDSTLADFPPPDLEWRLRTLHSTGPYVIRAQWRHAGGRLTLLVRQPSGSVPEPRPKGPVRP